VGIWYSTDPAGQGFSPYLYAGNNPLLYIDEDGQFWWVVAGAAIGAYLGGASAQDNWEWNPTKWENNFGTYLGVIGGGLAGGFAANAIAGMHGLMLTLNGAEWGTIGGSNTLLGNITSALGGGLLGIIPGKSGNELSQENGGTGNGSNKSDILSSDYPDAKYIEYIYAQGSLYEDPRTGIPVYNTYEVIQPGPFAKESYIQNTYFYTGEEYWYNGEPTPWVVDRLQGGLQDAGLMDPYSWLSGLFAYRTFRAFQAGKEYVFGKDFRIAPFGNRAGHPTGRFPHYHRRVIDPRTGEPFKGQGIRRHRPWEFKSTDRSFWDRF
jgi:hypothetical protein